MITYAHICESSTLSLTNDPYNFGLVSGQGAHIQNLGALINSEADTQGIPNLCGDFSEPLVTSAGPVEFLRIPTGNSDYELSVEFLDPTSYGSWPATFSFHLIDYPLVAYSYAFSVTALYLEPQFPSKSYLDEEDFIGLQGSFILHAVGGETYSSALFSAPTVVKDPTNMDVTVTADANGVVTFARD